MKTLPLRWLVSCVFALIVVGCGGQAPTNQTSLAPTRTTAISFASLEEDDAVDCTATPCDSFCVAANPCNCYADYCSGGDDGTDSSEASCSAAQCGGIAMVQVCSAPDTAWVDCSNCTGGCD